MVEYVVDDMLRFQCDICESDFKNATCLKIHFRMYHGNFDDRCKYCDAIYPYTLTLKLHEKSCMVGDKPYKCNTCDKTFA